jgi:Flp pilus assembly protein TadB
MGGCVMSTEVQLYSTEDDLDVIRRFGNAAAMHAIAEVLRNTDLVSLHTVESLPREVICTPMVGQPADRPARVHWLPVTILATAGLSVATLVCVIVVAWVLAHVAVVAVMAGLGALLAVLLRSQRSQHRPQAFSGTFEGTVR